MTSHAGEEFVKNFISHAYDPIKAHEYYMRVRKLKGKKGGSFKEPPKGRKSGTTGTSPTNRHRANAIATNAAANVGSKRSAAIERLAAQAKEELDKITADFRDWVAKHPKATTGEKTRQRDAAIDRKNDVIRKLKADVAKITSAASSKKTPAAATEGRQPAK